MWTFKLRPNMKFHDGQTITAKDVVATFTRLAGSGSASLSVLKGVLSKNSAKAVDDHTVEFHLDAPNGNFPYYVSSNTYNAVILSANFSDSYEKSFIGTGAFKLEKSTRRKSARRSCSIRISGAKRRSRIARSFPFMRINRRSSSPCRAVRPT